MERETAAILLRMPSALKELVKQSAIKNRRSATQETIIALERYLAPAAPVTELPQQEQR